MKEFVRKHILAVLLLFAAGFICYVNSFNNSFLWDDQFLVVKNPYIKSFHHILKIFTQDLFYDPTRGNYYRPIQSLSLMVDYFFGGLKPFGYHFTNTLIHIVNGILIYLLLHKFIIKENSNLFNIAFLTAVFWIVHPIHTQAVTYISGRADPLAVMFILLALIMQVTSYKLQAISKTILQFLAYVSYIFALLSKEMAIIFPILLILVMYCKRHCEPKAKQSQDDMQRLPHSLWSLAMTKKVIPYFIISAVYIFMRLTILNFSEKSLFVGKENIFFRILTFCKAIVCYVGILIAPINLHMERSLKVVNNFFDIKVIVSLIVVLLISIGIKKAYKKNNILFLAAGWFFITLFPVSNIFALNVTIAEHWLYLPSIGFFIILAYGFTVILDKIKDKKYLKVFLFTVYCLLLILCSALTIQRNGQWKNPLAFYQKTLKNASDSHKVHNNLGGLYEAKGELNKALKEYKKAVELNPESSNAYDNIGNIYDRLGEYDKAIEYYKKALKVYPKNAKAYVNLGNVYETKGMYEQAVSAYKTALRLNPAIVEAYTNLGTLYSNRGMLDSAMIEYGKALKWDPDHYQTIYNIGVIYERKGMFKKAIDKYKKSKKINPDFIENYISLRNLYTNMGWYNEAEKEALRLISIQPDRVDFYNYLGVIYAKQGKYKEAGKIWKQALHIEPDSDSVKKNLLHLKNLRLKY